MNTLATRLLVVLVVAAAVLGAVDAVAQDVAAITDAAADLIADQQVEEALAELDRALEIDDEYWEAHYQRGRALALLDRMDEAKEALLRATELNPGHAHAHQLASLAARNSGDMETSWDQAIRAYLAGAEPGDAFGNLNEISTPPDDIDYRINAWRVYVAGVDVSELEASADLPANARGGGGGAQETLVENTADLARLQRHLANAVSDSPDFGVVLQPERAGYIMTISVDSLGAGAQVELDGYLRLYAVDDPEPIYFRQIELRDISAAGAVQVELERYVGQLAQWRRERLQQQ